MVGAGAREARVLIRTLSLRISAARAIGDVVRLANPSAVAGVGGIALTARRVTTGRACGLVAVVMALTRAIAVVLVRAFRLVIAAQGGIRLHLVDAGTVDAAAVIGKVALVLGRVAARHARRLITVVLAHAVGVTIVLVGTRPFDIATGG
jgi:hypothetical protein